ncbi:MAG: lamin tail domain-containing protein [Actinomycetota bacterium]|nr:lamin tail domain-containing protein [Actinomycetota bacterium]
MRTSVQVLVPLVAALTGLTPVVTVAADQVPAPAPVVTTFAVIGDTPYSSLQLANFPYVVDQINADPDVDWVAHLGDIKSGSSVCSDDYFATVRSQFDRFVDPLVYTPGDNEWTDCHRTNNGAYDPLERLDAVREVFFPVRDRTLGQNPMRVDSQWRIGLEENVRFSDRDAVYAAAHVVGSNNGLAPWTGKTAPTFQQAVEVTVRSVADLALIKTAFLQAKLERDPLVVLMIQADMFDPTVVNPVFADYSAFQPIVKLIAQEAAAFSGKVLLLDGDSHGFVVDNPLASGSKWLSFYGVRKAVSNLTRITVEGSTGVDEWLKISVDESAPSGFTYERVPFAPSPVTHVEINEVESQGGTPGDWVELVNRSGIALDVSGYVLKDDDDTHIGTIPAGSVIPANGYLAIDESVLGYGLGGNDQARFFARDGVTLLDSTTWPGHAASTWGRCPDGAGNFGVTSAGTKGAANNCEPLVVLNEIESSGGTPGDWVELYNPGPSASDVSGWVLRDSNDASAYAIPAGTVVPSGGYLVLDEAQFGFGLGGADSARLFRADGALHDSYTWTSHAAVTYGRCPNAIGAMGATFAVTKGAANSCAAPVTTVKINEVESSGGTPGDWVELINTGSTAVDLTAWQFVDNDPTHTPYSFPVGTSIAAGGLLVLDEAQFGFGLGSADSARLIRADAGIADEYAWTSHATTSYGRCPDGSGSFATTNTVTKGAANDCVVATPTVVINEVESNGGTPGDWVELKNTGTSALDISGWTFVDGDPTHTPYTFPAGSVIAPGGYFLVEEAQFGFGLGSADSANFADAGAPVVSHSWTGHALVSWGRCPDGTGAFADTTASTKGAANACGSPVVINEVESSGGTPGDWVELYNPSGTAADISGFTLRDSNDAAGYVLPAGTTVPALGFLVLDEATFGFGLGSADSARLFGSDGTTVVSSYSWTAHATSTYGRCPDGAGAFETTVAATKGSQNHCAGIPFFGPWPGGATVATVDDMATFTTNLSGLDYQPSGSAAPGTLWAVQNGPGTLYRLTWNGTAWVPDASSGWGAGASLRYPDGTGDVDSEGVTLAGGPGTVYVGSERNNAASSISRNAVLQFDTTSGGSSLTAMREWNLTADLPVTGANTGIEAVSWVPDSFLVASGFVDQTTGAAYDPAAYPDHGDGLFLVAVEATGGIYAYELDHSDGTFTRLATIVSGFPGVMALEFDAELGNLWAACDDTCQGRSSVLRIDATGAFAVTVSHNRPVDMPNLNNEGFVITPLAECTAGVRPVFFSDDSDTGGNSLRRAFLTCP